MFPGELSEVGREEGSEIFLLRCWLFFCFLSLAQKLSKTPVVYMKMNIFYQSRLKLYPCSKRLEAAEGAESGRGQEKNPWDFWLQKARMSLRTKSLCEWVKYWRLAYDSSVIMQG